MAILVPLTEEDAAIFDRMTLEAEQEYRLADECDAFMMGQFAGMRADGYRWAEVVTSYEPVGYDALITSGDYHS